MIIVKQKKKENIAEYILYMWYIEDLLRAQELDPEKIKTNIIDRFKQPQQVLQEIQEWYFQIVRQMEEEELQHGGHLSSLTELVHQLNDLHLNLINDLNEPKYRQAYYIAQPYIAELKQKSATGATEIEVCLNALYMLMMMRMKGINPASETVTAIETFSNMLAHLSQAYKSRP